MALIGSKWPIWAFSIFSKLVPQNESQGLTWMANIQNFSQLLPPKHLILQKSQNLILGDMHISNSFEFFNFFANYFTLKWLKMTHNGNFCHQSGVDELKIGNFGLIFNKNLNISVESLTDLQNRPDCFPSWFNHLSHKECYAMIKTDENHLSSESQLICTKPWRT